MFKRIASQRKTRKKHEIMDMYINVVHNVDISKSTKNCFFHLQVKCNVFQVKFLGNERYGGNKKILTKKIILNSPGAEKDEEITLCDKHINKSFSN